MFAYAVLHHSPSSPQQEKSKPQRVVVLPLSNGIAIVVVVGASCGSICRTRQATGANVCGIHQQRRCKWRPTREAREGERYKEEEGEGKQLASMRSARALEGAECMQP